MVTVKRNGTYLTQNVSWFKAAGDPEEAVGGGERGANGQSGQQQLGDEAQEGGAPDATPNDSGEGGAVPNLSSEAGDREGAEVEASPAPQSQHYNLRRCPVPNSQLRDHVVNR